MENLWVTRWHDDRSLLFAFQLASWRFGGCGAGRMDGVQEGEAGPQIGLAHFVGSLLGTILKLEVSSIMAYYVLVAVL